MLGTATREEMRRSFAEGIPCGFGFTDGSNLAICPNGSVWMYEPIGNMTDKPKTRPAQAKTWLDENEKTITKILDEAGNRGWMEPKKEMMVRRFVTRDVTGDPAMTDNERATKQG